MKTLKELHLLYEWRRGESIIADQSPLEPQEDVSSVHIGYGIWFLSLFFPTKTQTLYPSSLKQKRNKEWEQGKPIP